MALEVAVKHVPRNSILGLGSGSTVAYFARALGELNSKNLLNLKVVPSSMQAWLLARENKLELHEDSARCPSHIDVAVDGADQIDAKSRAVIKGGGGALFREKIILSTAKKCYILGDEKKFVGLLSRSVPVEVSQFSMSSVEEKIRTNLKAEPTLRKLDKGYPFFTENGNIILDCLFPRGIENPKTLEREIKMIPGVVEAGIFNIPIERFYKGNQDGSFESF